MQLTANGIRYPVSQGDAVEIRGTTYIIIFRQPGQVANEFNDGALAAEEYDRDNATSLLSFLHKLYVQQLFLQSTKQDEYTIYGVRLGGMEDQRIPICPLQEKIDEARGTRITIYFRFRAGDRPDATCERTPIALTRYCRQRYEQNHKPLWFLLMQEFGGRNFMQCHGDLEKLNLNMVSPEFFTRERLRMSHEEMVVDPATVGQSRSIFTFGFRGSSPRHRARA
jgi:hypothetical protein